MSDVKSYKNQKLTYSSDGRLLDEYGNAVMMDWEAPIMEKTAEIICRNGGRVLNVGFGMGIIDSFIQKYNVCEHWIIEPHIDVYTKMLKDGWHIKPNVKILYGDWQGYLKYLPTFDGIFFDTWEDDSSDFLKLIPNFMNEDAIFSYFNNPRDDNKALHMPENEFKTISTWGEIDFESIDLEFVDTAEKQRTDGLIYWSETWKKYYCPIIKKKKNKVMASLQETKLSSTEMVNGPAHYGGADNPYEVIKVCEAWNLDEDAYLFNVIKYVARAGKKNIDKEIEDLEKALFYLNRKIENLKK